MPIIRVDMLKGRTKKQKQNLVKELTQAFNRACGENHVGIDVILYEIEKENWSINGQFFIKSNPLFIKVINDLPQGENKIGDSTVTKNKKEISISI
mgnify:CR=1 FL=1